MTSNAMEISVIEKLKDVSTFQVWKFQIVILFKSYGLYEIVTKEKEKPDDNYADWVLKDAKAQKFIISTIEKGPLMHILSCTTSKEMFEKLCNIYERDSDQQKYTLLQNFFNYKFDKSSDVATHISNIENLAYRLKALNQEIDDKMIISKILVTLPEQYKYFISAWESMPSEDKNLSNLTARLISEEIRNDRQEFKMDVAFKVNEKICYKCNKSGHIARYCNNKDRINFTEKRSFKPNADHLAPFSKIVTYSDKYKQFCKICKKGNHSDKDCFFRNKRKMTNVNKSVSFLSVTENANLNLTEWVVDSGSSSHMVINDETLTHCKNISTEIALAKKDQCMTADKIGKIETIECVLNDVLYVPQLCKNLLSVSAITSNDGEVKFYKNKVEITKEGKKIVKGEKNENGLYVINLHKNLNEMSVMAESKENLAMLWHRRLGHLGIDNMKKLMTLTNNINFTEDLQNSVKSCEICFKGKLTRKPFGTGRIRASRPLELTHTDVVGPIETKTWDNCRYFLTCMDDYTHFVVIYLLRGKLEVPGKLKEYIYEAEVKWNLKAVKIRCDNGGEYICHELVNWCKARGTILDYSPPYTPQLNSTAERLNRTLMDKVRCLLFDSNLEKDMWGEALLTAAYILNRSPSNAIDTTPAEKWYQRKPNLSYLKIFGSQVFAKNLIPLRKLDSRCKKYVFIGYAPNGYRLWDEEKRKIIISRDVYFQEEVNNRNNVKTSILDFPMIIDEDECVIEKERKYTSKEDEKCLEQANLEDSFEEKDKENDEHEIVTEELGRGKRIKKPPSKLEDYVLLSYQDAITGPDQEKWKIAIDEEKKSLEKNETWTVIDRKVATGKRILSSRWVFRIKEDGKYKARLVVRGCEQKFGQDFEETYSPVVGSDALRILLALAIRRNNYIKKFDVRSAFLYGDLDEEIFMEVPKGYEDKSKKVFKLQKALYGLKQAPLKWNQKLTHYLKKEGLTPLKCEQCIFIDKQKSIILAIHVDDGILIGPDKKKLDNLLKNLKKKFEMTEIDEPNVFLGIELEKNNECLKLSQKNYIQKMLNKYCMAEAKPSNTPMLLCNEQDDKSDSKAITFPYREAVGSLLYVSTKTRPDISYAVGYCSRQVENPSENDLKTLKRIIRYLKGTRNLRISYEQNSDEDLIAYCDADYAGDTKDRKSTSGYVIYFCGGPISWRSRKQPIVATSSTEAEYIAAAECCRELIYLKTLVEELTEKNITPKLMIDNQSAIELIRRGIMNKRSKHIDVRYHFIKEQFDNGVIKIEYCSTNNQIADILTKPLGPIKFCNFKNKLLS